MSFYEHLSRRFLKLPDDRILEDVAYQLWEDVWEKAMLAVGNFPDRITEPLEDEAFKEINL